MTTTKSLVEFARRHNMTLMAASAWIIQKKTPGLVRKARAFRSRKLKQGTGDPELGKRHWWPMKHGRLVCPLPA